jgi:bacterioferritin (cytochrome b1)
MQKIKIKDQIKKYENAYFAFQEHKNFSKLGRQLKKNPTTARKYIQRYKRAKDLLPRWGKNFYLHIAQTLETKGIDNLKEAKRLGEKIMRIDGIADTIWLAVQKATLPQSS